MKDAHNEWLSPTGISWKRRSPASSWPLQYQVRALTSAFRYTLESVTNIPATTWSPITNNAIMNGDLFTVQLDTSGPQRLFRLRK